MHNSYFILLFIFEVQKPMFLAGNLQTFFSAAVVGQEFFCLYAEQIIIHNSKFPQKQIRGNNGADLLELH
jgi:hypothetical protein